MSQNNKFADIFASEYGSANNDDFIEDSLSTSNNLSDIFTSEYGSSVEGNEKKSDLLWNEDEIQADLAELDRIEKEYTVPNLTGTTVNNADDIFRKVYQNPDSAESIMGSVANPDFKESQQVDSSDYGLFQINDKYWSETSQKLVGKSPAELNPFEQIDVASAIEKSPLGYSNWVAYQNKGHKEFEGITDEEIVNKYNVSSELLNYINQPGKFDNPQLIKQIMLAESGGDANAINVNYSPQDENNPIVPDWAKNVANFVTTQAESTYQGPERTAPVEEGSEITAFPPREKSILERKKYYEENQLSLIVPLIFEKSLMGKALGISPDIQEDMAMLDANPSFAYGLASDIGAFLTPVDALAFSRLAGIGSKLFGPIVQQTASTIAKTGVPPKKAIEIAQKTVFGYLNKSASMSMGVGGHSAANEFFNQLNKANVSDFDSAAIFKSFGVGATTGLAGGIGAGIFGKTFSRMGQYPGSVGEFLGEVSGFAISGEALIDSDIPLLDRLSDPKTYAHSAGMILSMRLIHGVGRELPKKINSITKEQVSETIENNFQKNLSEKTKESNQLELDLFNEQVKEAYSEAVVETAKQLELPLNLKTKDSVDNFTKKAKKDIKKSPKTLESEIEKNESKIVRTEKEKENTGVDLNLSKRRTKKAKEAKKRNELAQEIANKIEAGEYGNSPKEIQNYQNNAKQVEKILQKKAEKKPSTEVNLDRDVPTQGLKQKNQTKRKQPKKTINPITKVEKASQLQPGKNEQKIKGERGVTLKNKSNFDNWVNKKQSKHLGTNISIRYVERPDGKIVAKIFEVTKDQPLEKTTKGWARKIEKEDLGAPDIPNPENAYSDKIKIQRLEHEINELAFGRDKQLQELLSLETKSVDLFNKDLSKLNEKQTLQITKETGKSSDYMQKLRLSIDARNKRIKQSKKELRSKMTALELAQDTVKKLSRRTSTGSLNPSKKQLSANKDKNKVIDREVVENLKELWKRMTDGTQTTKSKFLKYLSDLNLKDPDITKYVQKHFDDIVTTAKLENAQEISEKILMTPKQSDGTPKPVRKTPDELQYAGPVSLYSMFPKYNQAGEVKVLKELIDNFGYDKVEKIRNRRTAKEMRRISRKKDVLTDVFSRIVNNEGKTLNFSEHVIATADITKTMIELAFANPKRMENPVFREFFNKTLFVFSEFRSEAGRALRATGLEPETNPKLFEIMANIPKEKSGEFRELMSQMTKLAEITKENPTAATSLFWMIAEGLRNNKLFSFTSLYKSVVGNAQHSAMELLTSKLGLKLGFSKLLDPKRKQSGISRFDYNKYKIVNRTEVYHEAFFGKNGAIPSAMEIMKENPDFLRDNPLLINEAYSRFIPGKVGKVIRAPQNAQGALDALFRLPWTVTRFEDLVIRQAVRELRREIGDKNLTNENVLERSNEIKQDSQASERLLSESKAYAAEMVFQAPFRSKAGRKLNAIRTDQMSASGAFFNWQIPFVLTYKNVFAKAFEFSPLVFTTHNFWEGLRMHRGNLHKMPLSKHAGTREKNSDLLAETLARGTLGTGLATVIFGTAMALKKQTGDEVIIGSGSDLTPEERDINRVLGKDPNSIKLGNNYVSFSTLGEPFSIYFAAASNYHDKKTRENKTALQKATQVFANWTNNNPIFLQADLMADVINGSISGAEFLAKKTVGELPPTFLKQLKSIRDGQIKRFPRKHRLKDSGEEKNAFDKLFDASKKELSPFWAFSESKDIDPSRLVYDLFGNPVPKNSNILNMVNLRYTEDKTKDDKYLVEREYLKVFPEKGENMEYLGGKISFGDGYTMEMSPRELQYLHQYTGKAFKEYMEPLVRHKNWSSPTLDPVSKRELFKNGREYVNTVAKATLLNKYYEIGKYVKAFDVLARSENIIINKGLLTGDNEETNRLLENVKIKGKELRDNILPNMSDEDLHRIHELMTKPNRYHKNKQEAMSLLKQNMPQAEGWMLNNIELFEEAMLNKLKNQPGTPSSFELEQMQ